MKRVLLFAALLLIGPLSFAQTADKPKTVTLQAGTEIGLEMAQDVSSRGARPGEPVELSLAQDLKVDGVLVAKSGARALGEVVQAKKPDFWEIPEKFPFASNSCGSAP